MATWWILSTLLGCLSGPNAPPPYPGGEIRASLDATAQQVSPRSVGKLVAGCWDQPVDVEYAADVRHLPSTASHYWRASTRIEESPDQWDDLATSLTGMADALSDAQSRYPESAHMRFEAVVDARPFLRATSVRASNGGWEPAGSPLDEVIELELVSTCLAVLETIASRALEKHAKAIHGTASVLVPENGRNDHEAATRAGALACEATGTTTARNHVRGVLRTLERQTGEPWAYYAKPLAVESPWSCTRSTLPPCNSYQIQVIPHRAARQFWADYRAWELRHQGTKLPAQCGSGASPPRPPEP